MFLAERSDISAQPVQEMSASPLVGWYLQPPACLGCFLTFCAVRISRTACGRTLSMAACRCGSTMPETSDSISVEIA